MSNWQLFCKHMCFKCRGKEAAFEERCICLLVFILGWDRKTDIIQQRNTADGQVVANSHHRKMDILLNQDIVIEMKAPNVVISANEERQIQQYIENQSLDFGFLISNVLRLYYKDGSNNLASPILELSFEDDFDNKMGTKLFDILTKEKYSREKMMAFCKEVVSLSAPVGAAQKGRLKQAFWNEYIQSSKVPLVHEMVSNQPQCVHHENYNLNIATRNDKGSYGIEIRRSAKDNRWLDIDNAWPDINKEILRLAEAQHLSLTSVAKRRTNKDIIVEIQYNDKDYTIDENWPDIYNNMDQYLMLFVDVFYKYLTTKR